MTVHISLDCPSKEAIRHLLILTTLISIYLLLLTVVGAIKLVSQGQRLHKVEKELHELREILHAPARSEKQRLLSTLTEEQIETLEHLCIQGYTSYRK